MSVLGSTMHPVIYENKRKQSRTPRTANSLSFRKSEVWHFWTNRANTYLFSFQLVSTWFSQLPPPPCLSHTTTAMRENDVPHPPLTLEIQTVGSSFGYSVISCPICCLIVHPPRRFRRTHAIIAAPPPYPVPRDSVDMLQLCAPIMLFLLSSH